MENLIFHCYDEENTSVGFLIRNKTVFGCVYAFEYIKKKIACVFVVFFVLFVIFST